MGRFCLGHPQLNPLSGKAKQLPIVNPFDRHGRVFFASWMSFMISFFAWYAFPPLLARTIRADLHLTPVQVLNSNIVALIAGFMMRVIVGPLCDQFGPRRVMTGILVCAAIPCGMAGLVRNVSGLYAIRFFVGLAGATFVPAMAWCSSWYDRNVVGTANGFAAGWGNAGAGVTYFVMPAAFDSLVANFDLTPHVAWRVAFIVPTIMLLTAAAFAFFLCDDLPTGKWSERHLIAGAVVEEPAAAPAVGSSDSASDIEIKTGASTPSTPAPAANTDKTSEKARAAAMAAASGQVISTEAYEAGIAPTRMEVVQKPTLRGTLPLLLAPQTVMLALPYACSFGGELAVNSILSSWYLKHFAHLGWTQTHAGRVAAIFGLLNVVTRPAGGFLADFIYSKVPAGRGLFAKKSWYMFLIFAQGIFLLAIGFAGPSLGPVGLVGLVCAMAVFMDAANGAAYSLLPHVRPEINGILSGFVGGSGNLGGIFWSVGYRFTNYAEGTWIIGVGSIAVAVICMTIPPISRSQRLAGGYMST